jgi:hypothetical protein
MTVPLSGPPAPLTVHDPGGDRTLGLRIKSPVARPNTSRHSSTLGAPRSATRAEADPKGGTSATCRGHFRYHLGPTESHTVSHTAGAA